ncbi:aldose 1-epimerase family protein [Pedobacter sp. SD-b]|uniref:Aldose 1-epimerase family protein n=1 Tax=Pedobacter segetis TaxID=2793069 RepID=A0ABS1BFJ2_9SPHI|nr:aldose 1-epimerase family protein [Pedobacter segetis]MBK0381637.1 aldose 1-epimerase family protein [Pedobacter segetis]
MIVLENEELKVTLSSKGAELVSLIDKNDHTEYIWQGNPDIWGYHAPNLFPIVGGLKDDTLWVDGEKHHLNRHGFARTTVFRKIEAAPQQAIFEIRYDDELLKIYPYKFEFQVIYYLKGRTLEVLYKVINMDDKTIYFSVGAHPGFNVPLVKGEKFEDYSIEFQYDDDLITHQLSKNGLFDGKTLKIPTVKQELKLTKPLFEHDALVFKNLKSKAVTLKSKFSTKTVKVEFPHFDYLGIWSKADAPFVCIEPWLGCADNEGEIKDIKQKEAIQKVKKGHVFETVFCISV